MTSESASRQPVPVGDLTVVPLFDGIGVEVARDILTRPGSVDGWACYEHHLGETGTLELPLGGFLVQSGDRMVLVDAGVGDFDNGAYVGGNLPAALRANGFSPDDVTDVVFTHLHFDHIGWASHRGKPYFRNATYRVHQKDWQHFMMAADVDTHTLQTLTPIESQLELFDGDISLAPGVDAIFSPGHTPGTTIVVVSSRGARAVLLGDVVHSVVQFSERDWDVIWDTDPEAARSVRNRITDQIADTEDIVVAAHLPGMQFGRIVTGDGPRRFIAL